MRSLLAELNRRNVIRVAVAYVVTAWVIMQVLELATDAFDAPAWTLKLAFTVLALGLVPAIVFSWVYELTPDGIRREADILPEQSVTTHTARRLDVAVLLLLLVAIALFVFDRMMPGSPRQPLAPETLQAVSESRTDRLRQANSVAVLPFVDLSPEGDQAYFSDGIAEEILNVLVRIEGLSVASRTSSFQFKGRDLGIPAIADALQVRHILEGSVRKAGETLRITAQLIDTADDRHLWSQTYDRALTAENVFEIQDEIAKAIVQALADALEMDAPGTVRVEATTDNLSAYDLYLRAKPLFQTRTRLLEADDMLARATALDPQFVAALELRAGVNAVLPEYEPGQSREQTLQLSYALANQVLALNSESAMAYGIRGNLGTDQAMRGTGDANWHGFLTDLQRAVSLDPKHTEGRNWLGMTLIHLGEVRAALEQFEICHGVDPYYRPCAENRLVLLATVGRDDDAFVGYLKDLDRGATNPLWLPLGLLARRGDEALFKSITNSSLVLLGWPRHAEFYAAYRNQQPDAELALDALEFATQKQTLSKQELALIFIPVGAYDLPPMLLYVWDASYADYRQSPQFHRVIKSAGIERYWRQFGFPPQCRAAGTDDFHCD